MIMAKQTLTVQLMHANAEIAELRAQVLDLEALLNAPKSTAYVAPKSIAPRALPAHFVAAREAAMRLGRSVRVAQS
jgi:hypothetical protein